MKKIIPNCEDVFKHLCDNLDQDMNSPQCKEIKKHMGGCPDCVTYLETLKRTVGLYQEYPIPPLQESSRKNLRYRIAITVLSGIKPKM